MHEFLIEQKIPYGMHEFTAAMSEDVLARTNTSKIEKDVNERIR